MDSIGDDWEKYMRLFLMAYRSAAHEFRGKEDASTYEMSIDEPVCEITRRIFNNFNESKHR